MRKQEKIHTLQNKAKQKRALQSSKLWICRKTVAQNQLKTWLHVSRVWLSCWSKQLARWVEFSGDVFIVGREDLRSQLLQLHCAVHQQPLRRHSQRLRHTVVSSVCTVSVPTCQELAGGLVSRAFCKRSTEFRVKLYARLGIKMQPGRRIAQLGGGFGGGGAEPRVNTRDGLKSATSWHRAHS